MLCLLPLYLFALAQTPYLDEADRLRADGALLRAESLYLSQEPQPENIFRIGLALSDISLRIGNTETRRQFFQAYLTRSKSWRGVSALVLAALAADRQAYPEFANYAELLFNEYPMDHPLRWRLLYHAARYTTLAPAKLKLDPKELLWFEAARNLKDTAIFPSGDNLTSLPVRLRILHLLEATEPFTLSEELDQLTGEDLYVGLLVRLKLALLQNQPAVAASTINQITEIDHQLERNDLRLFFYPLLIEFFKSREQNDRAGKVLRNLEVVKDFTLLPYVCHPNLTRPTRPAAEARPTPESEKPANAPIGKPNAPGPVEKNLPPPSTRPDGSQLPPAQPVGKNHAPPVEDVSSPKPAPDLGAQPPESFEEVERGLLGGSRNMELKIRNLDTSTPYRKIFRNYLFGLHYLNTMRHAEALDRLSVAASQVAELPFPVLEARIMMALAVYQDHLKHSEKAAWYRLQAMQIWTAPSNLPLFARAPDTFVPPANVLMDQALGDRSANESIHTLLHYSETLEFTRLLQRAYLRETLCANPVLGGQITQIGNQLAQLVGSLSENPDHEVNPRRFNETLELWNTLWQQSIPYYRNPTTPSVRDLQRALASKDRIVSFIEGERRIGVLLISKTQAFGLPLGDKKTFLALNEDERMGFLVGRLGNLWEGEGTLFLALSPTWRSSGLLTSTLKKVQDRSRLCLIFSIKSFLSEKARATCSGTAFFSNSSPPTDFEPSLSIETISLHDLQRRDFDLQLERHSDIIYEGPLKVSEKGLYFGDSQERLYFHEIVHYNPNLCSLTLVALAPVKWGELLEELELLNPSSAITINLVETISNLNKLRLGTGGNGVRFY